MFLYFLALRGAKLQDPLVLKFLRGGLGEYFDTQQVDHLLIPDIYILFRFFTFLDFTLS